MGGRADTDAAGNVCVHRLCVMRYGTYARTCFDTCIICTCVCGIRMRVQLRSVLLACLHLQLHSDCLYLLRVRAGVASVTRR